MKLFFSDHNTELGYEQGYQNKLMYEIVFLQTKDRVLGDVKGMQPKNIPINTLK